jgi:nitrite reductase/ring-hydroxylating ferredoxin subunit
MTGCGPTPDTRVTSLIYLCSSKDLADGGDAVPFDVVYGGRPCRAFAIRYRGRVHAYLNRCMHVAMEMDFMPNRFFDHSGQWLICATHGALYRPDTGACAGGPCHGGLIAIALTEQDGKVRWHTDDNLQPIEFRP